MITLLSWGGRVGRDGIHGATFSSEAMDEKSPATAVQIGDPITQKKMSDAIVKEARDMGLYTSITDNGAGGISCSIAEMARECGGCEVALDKVPLKYPGLEPWQIWISESQERMTMSVPKKNWKKLESLMKRRGVEATVVGTFNDSGKCVVNYGKQRIVDLDMEFLHDGLPSRKLKTKKPIYKLKEPKRNIIHAGIEIKRLLKQMLERPNLSSFEFVSKQYDHEVQAGSVIKPLQGRGRVNGQAYAIRPVLDSKRGAVLSHGINPTYSDIDTYHMAACAIDTAVRNAVSAGASLKHLAILDNFCWSSSNEPERLYELKRAVKSCYDTATAYGTPFISGKDSMFNDFKGFAENGRRLKISVPPTLLVSAIGVVKDISKVVTEDTKAAGDVVYLLGETKNELGASEYFNMLAEERGKLKEFGTKVPKVNLKKNKALYEKVEEAIDKRLVTSSMSVTRGGLGVALSKMVMASGRGLFLDLLTVAPKLSVDEVLFSESQGRVVVTVSKDNQQQFEELFNDRGLHRLGVVTKDPELIMTIGHVTVRLKGKELLNSYRKTLSKY